MISNSISTAKPRIKSERQYETGHAEPLRRERNYCTMLVRRWIKQVANYFGMEVTRINGRWRGEPFDVEILMDLEAAHREIPWQIENYTMTSLDRVAALIRSTSYLVRAGIQGDLIECGVWRGGSMMAAALTLIAEGDTSRNLYLFDTFEGMSAPGPVDKDIVGNPATALLEATPTRTGIWCFASVDEVRENILSTGYPPDRIHLIKGRVEDTLPHAAVKKLALVRLDTDWYESTLHELRHLFPALEVGGVLILDDYGHWQGAKAAADEYFAGNQLLPYLHRVDYTCRLVVKCQS